LSGCAGSDTGEDAGIAGLGGATGSGGAIRAGDGSGGGTSTGGVPGNTGGSIGSGGSGSGGATSTGGTPGNTGGATASGGKGYGGSTDSGGGAGGAGTGGNLGAGGRGGISGVSGTGGEGGTAGSGGATSNEGGNGGTACNVDPVSPNASRQAKNLLCYVYRLYGNHVLSGQQETSWSNPAGDISWYASNGLKYPAILGGDFLYRDGDSCSAVTSTTTRAIATGMPAG
jgi:hypothetical protein